MGAHRGRRQLFKAKSTKLSLPKPSPDEASEGSVFVMDPVPQGPLELARKTLPPGITMFGLNRGHPCLQGKTRGRGGKCLRKTLLAPRAQRPPLSFLPPTSSGCPGTFQQAHAILPASPARTATAARMPLQLPSISSSSSRPGKTGRKDSSRSLTGTHHSAGGARAPRVSPRMDEAARLGVLSGSRLTWGLIRKAGAWAHPTPAGSGAAETSPTTCLNDVTTSHPGPCSSVRIAAAQGLSPKLMYKSWGAAGPPRRLDARPGAWAARSRLGHVSATVPSSPRKRSCCPQCLRSKGKADSEMQK